MTRKKKKMMTTNSYKTFADVEFGPHPRGGGTRGTLTLHNGIEVSIVSGKGYYSSQNNASYSSHDDDAPTPTYEIAMFASDEFLPLGTHDDVLGWQTVEDINKLLTEAQEDGVKFMDKLDAQRQGREFGG